MPANWSRIEVEATVADYFDMFDSDLRGRPYNKTTHRKRLSGLLHNRSDGAIERKHQNISAILIELGFPYIPGYKPLGNYQQLLFDVVVEQLTQRDDLETFVRATAQEPAAAPAFDDILRTLVEAPRRSAAEPTYVRSVREKVTITRPVDYLAMEARNASLGAAGEDFVVLFEQARLESTRHSNLAAKVERISTSLGDGAGFDVLSFEETGRERLIEVKTTAYGRETPFFVTRNELLTSVKRSSQYALYRVFDFRRDARLFLKTGQIDHAFTLDAVQYLARVV